MRRIRTTTGLLVTACVAGAALASPVRAASDSAAAPAGPATNGRIAYVDVGDDTSSFDVFTVRPGGGGVRRLTATGDAFSPAWSPDGRRIVFERNRLGAGTQFWVMGPRGRHKRLLLSGLQGGRFPSWSPTGSSIVFAADAARETRQLFVYRLRTGTVSRLTSPGRLHRLTRSAFSEFDPAWSPDGTRIAYTRSWQEQPCRSDVFVIAAGGGTARKVLDRGCDDAEPSWAPDGTRIVLSSN